MQAPTKSGLSTGSLVPDLDLVKFRIRKLIIASTSRPLKKTFENMVTDPGGGERWITPDILFGIEVPLE